MKMIYPFNTANLPKLNEVGGKAQSLARMMQAGFSVPPGFALTVVFFEPWLATVQTTAEWEAVQTALRNGDTLVSAMDALKTVCEGLKFTTEQEQQLEDAVAALGDNALLAVRSSSPEEDLAGASFAGGYETSLGVTATTLPDAVRHSFASAFDERVFVYKQQNGFATEQPRIAVIVQQQIAAECAGVGFSLNPINNDCDEAVVDANWGLGETIVSGQVSPDHFVVDKVTRAIVDKQLGSKETSIWLHKDGGVIEKTDPRKDNFSLSDPQLFEIVDVLKRIEGLYEQPMDIEWAFSHGKLYLLQARPIIASIPLVPEMQTEPGARRTLYWDAGLTEGLTINTPMSPLTLDWMFQSGNVWVDRLAAGLETVDVLFTRLLANVDQDRYRAEKKSDVLHWGALLRRIPGALWHSRHFEKGTVTALRYPEQFYGDYEQAINNTVAELKQSLNSDLSLAALHDKNNELLASALNEVSFPALTIYFFYLWRLHALFKDAPDEIQKQVDSMEMGFANNMAVNISLQLYHMSQMLTPADFSDLDHLAQRVERRDLPTEFPEAWDAFIDEYGSRGPGELELSNSRYGDDPTLGLEQMSYMVESDFDPERQQTIRVAERKQAYEQLLQTLTGRKRRQLQQAYEMIDLTGGTRDTPKYLMVLVNGAFRQRALREGEHFVAQGRLDAADDIFWFTLGEIERANADPYYDLRQVKASKQPFYEKIDRVLAFPHLIDSRGRIGQITRVQDDPNVYIGLGISRGTATGRVKVLHTPREKPIEQGDVLVAYTTDPGWTPLFVNAEAIILEVDGMLQHGGVVAREYGKPCVAGIQGITTTLQDGQRVEVDGTSGVVRVLEE